MGIFWLIPEPGGDVLVIDGVPLADAEPYGDCLTHPRGHYDVWERWRCAGPSWLKSNGLPIAICTTEYEQHPRGRVVYDRRSELFIIYADRRLQTRRTTTLIVDAFGLPNHRFVLRSDDHYR